MHYHSDTILRIVHIVHTGGVRRTRFTAVDRHLAFVFVMLWWIWYSGGEPHREFIELGIRLTRTHFRRWSRKKNRKSKIQMFSSICWIGFESWVDGIEYCWFRNFSLPWDSLGNMDRSTIGVHFKVFRHDKEHFRFLFFVSTSSFHSYTSVHVRWIRWNLAGECVELCQCR